MKKYLILENIRSMQNVGAIFRNADGAGFEKIYLCGYTPFPPRSEIAKTALGAHETIDWEYYNDINEVLEKLEREKTKIYSVELSDRSVDYKIAFQWERANIALVLWNEVSGVSQKVLDISDKIVMIPMLGKKESLNVSVAAGIVMYATV